MIRTKTDSWWVVKASVAIALGLSLLATPSFAEPKPTTIEAIDGRTPSRAGAAPESLRMLDQLEDLQEMIAFQRPRDYSTIRYSNGTTATILFAKQGASWYWPNGKLMTSLAGRRGSNWYWPNGTTMTMRLGSAGSTWRWPDGSTLSTSGPELSDQELMDVPAFAVRMLRAATRRGF